MSDQNKIIQRAGVGDYEPHCLRTPSFSGLPVRAQNLPSCSLDREFHAFHVTLRIRPRQPKERYITASASATQRCETVPGSKRATPFALLARGPSAARQATKTDGPSYQCGAVGIMKAQTARRGGRVVDRTRLESGLTLTGNGSSNLPLSASLRVSCSTPPASRPAPGFPARPAPAAPHRHNRYRTACPRRPPRGFGAAPD